ACGVDDDVRRLDVIFSQLARQNRPQRVVYSYVGEAVVRIQPQRAWHIQIDFRFVTNLIGVNWYADVVTEAASGAVQSHPLWNARPTHSKAHQRRPHQRYRQIEFSGAKL